MKHNPDIDLVSADNPLGVVSGEVLKLWMSVEGFQEAYETLLTEERTYFGNKVPTGYVPVPSKNQGSTKVCKPIKHQLVTLIICLSKVHFEKRLSLREASVAIRDAGVSLSHMGLRNYLERLLDTFQLRGVLPKGKQVQINNLADAEKLVQRERKNYAQQARKARKSAEEVKSDMAEVRKATARPTKEKIPEQKVDLESEEYDEFRGREIIYEPTPKQMEFHAASETIVLYGGAAGGGKSFALLFDVIRFAHVPGYKGLIIRRTMPELKELIDTSKEYYPKLFPGAKYKTQDHVWVFPSGAQVIFGYLEKPNDKYRYQGQQYQYIGFDELGQWIDAEGWNYLKSRLRNPPIDPNTGEPIPLAMRATSNPGANWVKEMFIDVAPPNTTFYDRAGVSHRFIPASLLDNPYLDDNYRKMLESLPEIERRQLLYGDWNATSLAAFPEFRKDTHVVEPFEIPLWWNRICGMDYGYRDPACAVWIAIHPNTGQKIVYREYSQTDKTGLEYARDILEIELKHERIPVDHIIDWTIFNKTGYTGPTIGEQIIKAGIKLRQADRNRTAGKVQVHEHLRQDVVTNEPGLIIFSTCKGLINQLNSAQIDEKNPDDIDQRRVGEDKKHHWDLYDCLRYALMSRPTKYNRAVEAQQYKQNARWGKINDYFK